MSKLAALFSRIRNDRFFAQLIVLIAVSVAAVYAGLSFDETWQSYMPEAKSNASTYNRKPSGLSGLMTVAENCGLDCHQWILPYRQLPEEHGALVIVAPLESLENFEVEKILDWVEEGNDLIYIDNFTFNFARRLIKKCGLSVTSSQPFKDKVIAVPSRDGCFEHVPELVLSADSLLDGGEALLPYKQEGEAGSQGALFCRLKHGDGHIIVGSAPGLCANRLLSDKRYWPNFQFLYNCLARTRGSIWFDERCHGYSQNVNVFVFLSRGTTGAVFAQLMLILLVGVVSSGQRFGSVQTVKQARTISNLEFINGLANAYRRARANSAVLEIIGQSVRQRLCKAIGVSPHESTEKVVEQWKARTLAVGRELPAAIKPLTGADQDLPAFLEHLDRVLKQPAVSDGQLRTLAASCDKIAESLEAAPGSAAARGRAS